MSKAVKLAKRIEPQWSVERTAQVRAGLARRTRRSRQLRTGLAAVAGLTVFAAAAFVVAAFPRSRGPSAILAPSANPTGVASVVVNPPPSAQPGGNSATVTVLEVDTLLVPEPNSAGRAFALERGGARFFVAHDEAHPFRVRAGSVVVEDVGTVFTVQRRDGAVEVAVDEGRVRVRPTAQSTDSFDLGPGEHRTFATDDHAGDAGAGDASVDGSSSGEKQAAPKSLAGAAWKPLAESGRYGEAYESLRQSGRGVVRDEAGELLLAADAARLSGHAADAVPYLEQVLRRHPSDSRAALAAFTLGRVQLDELGHPTEAAAAFDVARRDGGALAEDALAREVEAYSRAGDMSRARALALEYRGLYPNGRRQRSVAKFGGLE